MILTQAQAKIAKDSHRFRVVDCGRRFGKTTESVEEIKGKVLVDRDVRIKRLLLPENEKENILKMSSQDEYRARVNYYAETYKDARDIAWGMLLKELEPIIIKTNDSRLELIVKNQDGQRALIKLRGWESVESARGTKSDFDVYDEVAKYKNFWMYWHEVLRPTLTDYLGEAIFYSTPRGFNHFYDLFNLESGDADYKSFHFTSYDNSFLSVTELEKAKKEMTEDRFAQEYLADFRKTEGLVYKEFSRDRHLFEEEPKKVIETIAGIDFGFTNPCAVISIKRDDDNRFYVTDEWYKTQRTEGQIADHVASCKFNKVYPDPENPSAIEVLNQKGISVSEVIKGKDSIKSGINKVRELFKQNRLFIHKSCKNLISELETYSYPERRPNQPEPEVPIKENDHALDALRYAIMSTFTLNIESSEQEQAERLRARLKHSTNQTR